MSSAIPATHTISPSPPRAGGAQGLSSVLSRYFEASLYLMLYTAVLTLVATGKLDLFTTVAAPAALVWKGFRRWRGRGPELSARIATGFVAAYFLFVPVDYFWARGRAGDATNPALYALLLTTMHLLLFSMMVRLYSARARRDYLFLAMLAFACMLGAAVLTIDTAYLIFFLLFLALGTSTFISLEMQRGAEGAMSPPMDSDHPSSKKLVRALGLTSGTVAMAAMVLGGVLFFLLPRFNAGYFASYSLRPRLMTGFTENVELGQIGEIQKSSDVVMRVKVEGGPARFMNQHWRGIALTRFDGHRWSGQSLERRRIYSDSSDWFPVSSDRPTKSTPPLKYTVLLEPVASSAVFVAPGAFAVRGRFASGSGLGDPSRRSYLLMDTTGSIFNPFPNYSELSYDASSLPSSATPEQLRKASTKYPPEITAVYWQLPEIDARIPMLAQQITAGQPSPYDKAVAMESYLRTHFGYTLDLSGPPVTDPLANFLFVRRAGHCEYFASAMTIMLRSLGIPARYINGFQTGEYNDVGGDFIVRASDAHSWVEAYFTGYGWITFDPTPVGEAEKPGMFASIGKYLDWFQLQWGEWVINYDFLHQIALGQGLGRTSRQWASGGRERISHLYDRMLRWMRAMQVRAAAWPWTPPVLALVLMALVVLFGGRPLRKRISLMWNLRAPGNGVLSPRRASEHYQEMLRLLARRGYRKAEGLTPTEFATSIPQAELAVPVGRLTDIYQAARFGEAAVEPRKSVELLHEIRQQLSILPRATQ